MRVIVGENEVLHNLHYVDIALEFTHSAPLIMGKEHIWQHTMTIL